MELLSYYIYTKLPRMVTLPNKIRTEHKSSETEPNVHTKVNLSSVKAWTKRELTVSG